LPAPWLGFAQLKACLPVPTADRSVHLFDGSIAEIPPEPILLERIAVRHFRHAKEQSSAGCICADKDRPMKKSLIPIKDDTKNIAAHPTDGFTYKHLQAKPAEAVLKDIMWQTSKYSGYSSGRYLHYHAAQWLGR
jgi:hypothetical protein